MIIFNFLLGALMGYLTPILEPKMKSWAESILLSEVKLKDTEFDLLALLILLMVAAFICALIGVDSSAFMMAFGAIVGLFGTRIWAMIMARGSN